MPADFASLSSRIENESLLRKVVPVEEAVKHVNSDDVLAVSGFTKSAEPKVFMPALARRFEEDMPGGRFTLYSGASLSDEVEAPLAPYIQRRAPYMSCKATRERIHAGKLDYNDVHLSQFARNMMWGLYGDIDVAVVEVSRIRRDGSVVLTSSVGVSDIALSRAKKIVLEVNTAGPDYTGFHDIALPPTPPRVGWPVPITGVLDRVGDPYARVDPDRVVAVVESHEPGHCIKFKPTTETHRAIARNIIDFLVRCRDRLGWQRWCPPIQSGVGNVANAVIAELSRSPFQKIRFYTEVFQDGMLDFVDDPGRFEGASCTGLSFSAEGAEKFTERFERCREVVRLRPMWISNSAEIITRLFVIAMNTPVEFDIWGQVNSTHVNGERIVNGLGGSGDFFRNAYIGIAHTPSVRRLRDGRVVSCVMPRVGHVDHSEHDVDCYVTEQGFAENFEIRSARSRCEAIIEHCAHPHFRPLLREWMKIVGDDAPEDHLEKLEGWWADYDAACRSFPD